MKKIMLSTKLFKVYILFYSIFFSTLLIAFGLYAGSNMNTKIRSAREQVLESMNKNIENFFENINDFSMTLVNSKQFKNIVIEELPLAYESGSNMNGHFTDLYLTAYKMVEKEYKIGMYTNEGYYIWLGSNYFITKVKEDHGAYEEYRSFGQLNIRKIENHPIIEDYSRDYMGGSLKEDKTIALIRTVNRTNAFNHPEAYIEVHVPYEQLETLIENIVTKSEVEMGVYLFNEEGLRIYGEDMAFDITQYKENQRFKIGRYNELNKIVYVDSLLSSNLYMMTSLPGDTVGALLKQFIGPAILVFILLNVLLILITYKIAINITTPLNSICKEVHRIEIGSMKTTYDLSNIHTEIYEIEVLKDNLMNMQTKLHLSMEQIVMLKSFEVQSRLMALQSQIKPHFMYNTLMTIDALSQEGEQDKVSYVCQSLTSMLRYISADSQGHVLLAEEMEYVDQYITIMEERFPDLSIQWNIPLEMMDIQVPKLMIQPLVENSIKYHSQEPVKVRIVGFLHKHGWAITIKDNGKGFTNAQIGEIMERCIAMKERAAGLGLEINGMGLPNIYIRLKLLYGQDMLFHIKKDLKNGSEIQIGGRVDER